MHPHWTRLGAFQRTQTQGPVKLVINAVFEDFKLKLSVGGLHGLLVHTRHRRLMGHAVTNQISDRAHFEAVGLGKGLQFWTARHGPILIENFHQYPSRLKPGQQRQVKARFCVAGACQHATRLSHQRKDVARMVEVFGAGVRGHRRSDRVRPIVG